MTKVEKILERSFTHSASSQVLDCVSMDHGTCDPPCSVWCDFLPSAAKDTFQKYIRSGRTKSSRISELSLGTKLAYKRSLSADDSPIYALINADLRRISSDEPKEMLMLLGQNPTSYFKTGSIAQKDDSKRHRSSFSDLSDFQSRSILKNHSPNTWGPFDGADSLWKPLPDCVPSNETNQRQSAYKRGKYLKHFTYDYGVSA